MENPRKVVISGYYGFDNIGDEAVLSAVINQLRAEMPTINITVLSNNPEKTKLIYEAEAVNRWKIKEVAKIIKASDMLISGGGSLLQDVTSSKTIPYYLGIVKMAQWYKKKIVFYSQGIGPVAHGYNKWLIRKIVNGVDHIFVRDKQSENLLKDFGIKRPITVAADPVLGIKLSQDVYKYVKDLSENEKGVGVYIRPWAREEKLLKGLEKALQYIISEGHKVYLIPMYYSQDLDICLKLKKGLGECAVVIDTPLTVDEVMGYTSAFEFIIGMRLHSLIMAAAAKVPMVALSYDPKVTDFMKDMNIPYCIDVENMKEDELLKEVQRLMVNKELIKKHLEAVYEIQKDKINLPARYIRQQLL